MMSRLAAWFLCLLAAGPAWAQGEALHEAMAIVTGTDMRSRPAGFAQCLAEVLAKVSGEPRLLGDPRVKALRAEAFVQHFDYYDPMNHRRPHDDQGSYDRSYNLTVSFDPQRITQALAALGERPWPLPRPVIVPSIQVQGFGPPHVLSYRLTAGEPAAEVQRASFAAAAAKYGVALHIPDAAAFGQDAEAAVMGRLEFRPEALGWVGAWRMRWQGQDYAWGVSGVGFDEAFDNLVRGAVRLLSGHGAPD